MSRQYNLKNFNGVHLKAPYDYDSYNADGVSALIENFDFYPLKSTDVTDFEFINSSSKLVESDSIYYGKIMGDGFIGDNSYAARTHDLNYSQIKKTNELVKGEKYYTRFNFYFNFTGEDAKGFTIGSTGYTISVSLYAILGNTKRKLKLSDLSIYDYESVTYGATTSNPIDAGYVPITSSGSYQFYYNNVEINSDNIVLSYFPRPKTYDIINNMGILTGDPISYSYTQGDSDSPNYGNGIGTYIGPSSAARIISFDEPQLNLSPGMATPRDYEVIDNGYVLTELGPFDVMEGGPLFRATAQLDTTSQAEFDANICKGNKDMKIMVDYNGTISKTIITYEQVEFETDIAVSLPSATS
jgi:hypothetical protein